MAAKKSKTSNKSKASSIKPKTTTKPIAKVESKSKATATDTKKIVEETHAKESCFKGFFSRKYEEKESILTVFKNRKFYGSLLGEIFGTMFLALVLFSVSLIGIANIATYGFAVIAILIAVYAFSGACLNPLLTIGMIATRRMSVIRGVMYIIAEIIGAWLGWLIFNGFHMAGGETATIEVPTISAIAENSFLPIAMVELTGAAIISFFFNRALVYKRSVFTFAAVVAGGIILAVLVGYIVSAGFLGANNNFVFNPAVALMMNIFPQSGNDFGSVLGGICQALSVYAIIPMIGGIIGFYISDFTSRLSSEN